MRTVATYLDDSYWHFDRGHGGVLIVARQSHTVPPQIAAIDERTGKLTTLADLNPEIRKHPSGAAPSASSGICLN